MRIVYSGHFGKLAGKAEDALDIRKSTVSDVIDVIEKKSPGFRKESEGHDALILKNGVNIEGLRGLDTLLTDNDTLTFVHKVVGG